MIDRKNYLTQVTTALRRSPITALLGPRQCGKTTLAKSVAKKMRGVYFDLESTADVRRLQNPEMALADAQGLVILDEIQLRPELFSVLRVVVDKPKNKCKFLILGSASPSIVKNVSESLAGRVEFVDMSGFALDEVGIENWETLWVRGGFPRSFLAKNGKDSFVWREGFIRTFLQRDIPQLGIKIAAPAMRRFWTMLAHYHGQIWNASRIGSSLGINDKTARSYLDILTETYMIRQLQPWHENISKRQVKSPKIFFHDTGLLHSLLSLQDYHALSGHPQVGASWEGFALEQILQLVRPPEAYYWATYSEAELDLFFIVNGKRWGIEFKFSEAPASTRSMRIAIDNLKLHKLLIVYPGKTAYPIDEHIEVCPIDGVFRCVYGK